MKRRTFTLAAGLGASLAGATMLSGIATAQDAKLPDQIAWTAYGTGSAGYNQAVAIGAALKNERGVNLRVLPGKNDVARTEPLRQGKVQFSATGVGGSFMAQEGAFEFGEPRWGPQKVRTLLANNGGAINLAVGVAGDLGVESYADLKGKKVAYVKGAPALNVNMEAYLACGGLTWDDVERVDFGGFGDSWRGLASGQVDAAFASTNSGLAYEAASSPRGLTWPTIAADDAKCHEAMQAIAPFFTPNKASVGATIDGTDGADGATYAYPVLVAMAEQDADLVYEMTKAMVDLYPQYDGKAPGIGGWGLDKQDLQWVVPYHEGAIRYFKEAGVWSDEAQKHNDRLVEKQDVLGKAWDELKAQDVPAAEWSDKWAEARRAALEGAGFDVVF